MARANLDQWIPEQRGSAVLTAVNTTSAIEALARPEPMTSDVKEVPRSGAVDVTVTPKGSAYTESGSNDDVVTLRARKFTGLLRIADEDLQDIPENIVAIKQNEWANSYARHFDNACLGVTVAPADNGSNQVAVPFQSVYNAVATADAELGYAAGANLLQTGGAVTYEDLSLVLSMVENGDYAGQLVVIAHTSFAGLLRGLRNQSGDPITSIDQAGAQTLFGTPIRYSAGAKTSTAATKSPTGNPLLVVANRDMLIKGVRSGPEFAAVNGFTGASALTDEALIKARARRGFALGHPGAAAVLEVTAAPAGA